MEITKEQDWFLPENGSDLFFEIIDFGMHLLVRVYPLPVEIDSGETRPVVASNNAIGIQARHQIEDKVFSQLLNIDFVADKYVENALKNKAGVGFARVHPRGDDDGFAALEGLAEVFAGGYGYHCHGEPRQRFRKSPPLVHEKPAHIDICRNVVLDGGIFCLLFVRRLLIDQLIFNLDDV